MDWKTIWDAAMGSMAVVGIIAAFLGAVYAIIVHGTRYKAWAYKRQKRAETLDKLINSADTLVCSAETRQDHTDQLKGITDGLSTLTTTLQETIRHNKRQDTEIDEDRQERKLLVLSQLAVLDWVISQGGNGSAHEARDTLKNYQIEMSHKTRKEMQR